MKNTMKKRWIPVLLAVLLWAGMLTHAAAYIYNPFTDVSPSAWYYSDVMNAVQSGLINGKTDTTFCPDDYLTYAEAVKLASCLNQLWWNGSVTLTTGMPWYRNYADYAWTVGIITEEYAWNSCATRGRFLAMFANAIPADALPAVNDVPDGTIPDVSVYDQDGPAIYALYRAGIVQGSDDAHSCYPYDFIRRSEAAAILTRMMDSSARLSFTTAWNSYNDNSNPNLGYSAPAQEPQNPKYWITLDFFDRNDLTVYTEATTLGMILYNNGIVLEDDEVASVDLWNDWLAADQTITVDRWRTATESIRQIVPHTDEEIGIDTIPRACGGRGRREHHALHRLLQERRGGRPEAGLGRGAHRDGPGRVRGRRRRNLRRRGRRDLLLLVEEDLHGDLLQSGRPDLFRQLYHPTDRRDEPRLHTDRNPDVHQERPL